ESLETVGKETSFSSISMLCMACPEQVQWNDVDGVYHIHESFPACHGFWCRWVRRMRPNPAYLNANSRDVAGCAVGLNPAYLKC
ncbi:MAG: hypothetical protein QF560_09040, partial [SAR324 cluster bacterium]|nr:hypothetical protein [SAR324 cluster bacterium]